MDEPVHCDPSAAAPPVHQHTVAVKKALAVGALCNNAIHKEDGTFVGQSTDVALLNVLSVFGLSDPRQVRRPWPFCCNDRISNFGTSRSSRGSQNLHLALSASIWL